MNLGKAISILYPDAKAGIDFKLQDDGKGAYIKEWNLLGNRPTEQELKDALVGADDVLNERKDKPLRDAKQRVKATLGLTNEKLNELIGDLRVLINAG